MSQRSGAIEIRRCFDAGEEYLRSQAREGQSIGSRPVSRCIRFTSRDDAAAYLRNFVLKPDEISRVRSLLGEETFHVHRYSDQEVVEQIATALAQRRLFAIQLVFGTAPPAVVSSKRTVEYIPSRQIPPAIPPRRVREPILPAPPEINPLDKTDHDAQAATLEVASQNGVPFCEECGKARLNRIKTALAS
jgi:hypothetical protein